MPDIVGQYQLLMAIYLLTAFIWAVLAFSAFMSYRAFDQIADLAWTVGFGMLAIVRLGEAYVANRWVAELDLLSTEIMSQVEPSVFYRLRFSALEIVAAILVFYAFRARRQSF